MAEDGDASGPTAARSWHGGLDREEPSRPELPFAAAVPSADRLLLEQIHAGDPEAGPRFVRDYYPGVYRYLLYLTGSPEAAEDLTQETFLQAWRGLESFEGRSGLRTWLHRIAHRQLLQALRGRRLLPEDPLPTGEHRLVPQEAVCEVPEPCSVSLTETIELRVIIGQLPIQERQVVVLHYLEGYQHEEVAQILGISLRRVRQRLAAARGRLLQELAEGDLLYLNIPIIGRKSPSEINGPLCTATRYCSPIFRSLSASLSILDITASSGTSRKCRKRLCQGHHFQVRRSLLVLSRPSPSPLGAMPVDQSSGVSIHQLVASPFGCAH
jgi:RNA polymerase sigma-70 factor (ECF subfamily)